MKKNKKWFKCIFQQGVFEKHVMICYLHLWRQKAESYHNYPHHTHTHLTAQKSMRTAVSNNVWQSPLELKTRPRTNLLLLLSRWSWRPPPPRPVERALTKTFFQLLSFWDRKRKTYQYLLPEALLLWDQVGHILREFQGSDPLLELGHVLLELGRPFCLLLHPLMEKRVVVQYYTFRGAFCLLRVKESAEVCFACTEACFIIFGRLEKLQKTADFWKIVKGIPFRKFSANSPRY